MKKSDKFIILLLAFAALLMVATIGYRLLSEKYAPQQTPIAMEDTNSSDTNESADADDSSQKERIPAPVFTVYDMDGNELSLSDFLGKPVIVNFWATWCGPCQSEMPAFDKLYQEYKDQITFLMVNQTDGSRDTIESVTAFYEDSGYSFPIYFDTTLNASMTYGATSIPMTFFIDEKGYALYYQRGAMSEDLLRQCVEQLIEPSAEPASE